MVVLEGEGGHAAGDALVCILEGFAEAPGLGGVEVGDVHICPHVPMRGEFISQLGVSAVLLESQVAAVSVGAVVGEGEYAGEFAGMDAVGELGFQGVPGAVADAGIGADALLVHPAGDDIDHTSHGIGAVEDGCRSPKDFHPFSHEGLGSVGNGVPEEPHVLRVPVDKHHEAGGGAAQAAEGDAPGCAVGDPVAHDAAGGDEEPGHLFREYGQKGGLQALFYLLPPDDGNGEGEVADVGGVARAGDNYLFDVVMPRDGEGVLVAGGSLLRQGR